MIKSMTGYGAGKYEENGKSFIVEIKSVNHKYNDLSIRLPRMMLAFEDPVRKLVSAKVFRGKVDVFVNYESTSSEDNTVLFNEALGDNVFAELNKIKERYSFHDDISLSMMCRFPNIITAVRKETSEFDSDGELWICLEKAVNLAVDAFVMMRANEGDSLTVDLRQKIAQVESITEYAALKAPLVVEEYKEKLNARLKDLISDNIDEQRIAFEVAIFADKSSIDEELTRLRSHAVQFGATLSENQPIGKKLDFLAQEMLRESNTIGSKSNNGEIMNYVIQLKTLIEQIREQVQNVE